MSEFIINKAYKYKIIPTKEQKEIFAQWFGCVRFVYNKCAEIQLVNFDKKEKLLSNQDLDKLLPPMKLEFPFLKEVNSQALQYVTKCNARAIKKFFSEIKKGKKADMFAFKSKYNPYQSISFPNYNNNVKIVHDRKVIKKAQKIYIQIPKLASKLAILKHRNWDGEIKNVTLSKDGDNYYISLQVKKVINKLFDSKTTSTIGIDVGVRKLAVTSEGEVFKPLNSFKKLENKLARFQRKLARCVKKSNNFYRLKKQINKIHKKIAFARKDYLHKLSRYLVNNHATIFVEKLKINNMSKSAKGNMEQHGKNVAQKSGLNKSILDQGWGYFFDFLSYKQAWACQLFDHVDAKHSSQECCLCHGKHKDNRLSQAKFVCNDCGNSINADLNASLNIKYRGLIKIGLNHDEAQQQIMSCMPKKIFYSPWVKDVKASHHACFPVLNAVNQC